MQPRYYQKAAIDAVDDHLCNKSSNPCVVLPTAAGKSPTMAWTIQRYKQQFPLFRCLILAHTKELVAQNADKMQQIDGGIDIGIYAAGLKRRDMKQDIIFASISSIARRIFDFEPFDLIIVDEAHRIPMSGEGQYRKLVANAKLMNPKVRVVGMTATPYRMGVGDVCHKDHILNEICYEIGVAELIEKGHLCPLRSKVGDAAPDLSKVKKRGGEFTTGSLAEATDIPELVRDTIAEAVPMLHDRKAIIFFCVDLDHCHHVSEELAKYGIHAPCVTGNTPSAERDSITMQFTRGDIRAVCNVNVLTEGFDATRTDAVVLLRPTQSKGLFCLDEKTEILTADGWSSDVKVGTPCAVFDPGTEGIRYEPAIASMRRSMEPGEKFYSIKSPSADIRVTGNHRMVTRTSRSRPWDIRPVQDVASLKAGAYFPTSGIMENLPGLPLSDDDLRFIGWVMTDGHINKANRAIYISQAEHQPWLGEIDKCIQGCGFKYGRRVSERQSQYKSNSNVVTYSISYGKPRGRDKHLTGWARLEPYLSKDFAPCLNDLTPRQFDVLLHAIHLGDGSKQKGQSWTQRSYHINTGNRTFAERLQIAGVTHGYRASVATHDYNENPIYVVHLKKTGFINLGSTYDDRPSWTVEDGFGESCWCVETPTGTLVTRRNGRVAVLGNCQMVGRGLRLDDRKQDCLVLDFAECIHTHGPIDHLGGDGVKLEKCPECKEIFSRAVRTCPECGWTIPKKQIEREEAEESQRRMHGTTASSRNIISSNEPETIKVDGVRVARHKKPGKPDSLRVTYRSGLRTYSEWVCLDHHGPAGNMAGSWWRKRFQCDKTPTVDQALQDIFLEASLSAITKTITVRPRGKYHEITNVGLVGQPQPERTP